MADPLDKINKETLKALKNNTVVYDHLFSESPLKITYVPLAVRRQVDYGVSYAKAIEVYEEMIRAGTIEREPVPDMDAIRNNFIYGPPEETKE